MITTGGERGFLGFTFSPDGTHLYVDYTDRDGNTNVDEYAHGCRRRASTCPPAARCCSSSSPTPTTTAARSSSDPTATSTSASATAAPPATRSATGSTCRPGSGKILRIDPAPNGDQPYTVPADNPFVGQDGAKPEIWSYGLRNPWRFSFDRATKDLWIGDVGQDKIEEVDRSTVAEGAGKGVNFGWSAFEGRSRYNDDQSAEGAVGPAFQYTHANGNCSVTGGYLYRGSAIPALQGAYLYTDYCGSGRARHRRRRRRQRGRRRAADRSTRLDRELR